METDQNKVTADGLAFVCADGCCQCRNSCQSTGPRQLRLKHAPHSTVSPYMLMRRLTHTHMHTCAHLHTYLPSPPKHTTALTTSIAAIRCDWEADLFLNVQLLHHCRNIQNIELGQRWEGGYREWFHTILYVTSPQRNDGSKKGARSHIHQTFQVSMVFRALLNKSSC